MINTSQQRPVLVQVHVSDPLGQWIGALMNITKAVPSVGQQAIIIQNIDSNGNVNAWLIDGQRYTITLYSTDGLQVRNTGDLVVSYSTTTQILNVMSLPAVPSVPTYPSFNFLCYPASSLAGINYTDSTNETTSVRLDINWAGNGSNIYTHIITFNGTFYSIVWNGAPTNSSISIILTAQSGRYGTISQSSFCNYMVGGRTVDIGVPDGWYLPIAVCIIVLVALLFSVYSVSVGAILTLFTAGILWMWGWLPSDNPSWAAVLFVGCIMIISVKLRRGEAS
jgi:hypothetical protein